MKSLNRNKFRLKVAAWFVSAALAGGAFAADLCNDNGIMSNNIFTNVCWDCMFPMIVAGAAVKAQDSSLMSGTPNLPDDYGLEPDSVKGAPPDRGDVPPLCGCSEDGKTLFGTTVSAWLPHLMLEFTRMPSCSRALGGIKIPTGPEGEIRWGTKAAGQAGEDVNSFFHYHQLFFPVTQLLNMTEFSGCAPDTRIDLDLAFMSEYDPTWNDSQTAFFQTPEAAAAAIPVARIPCMAEGIAASFGRPINSLFWCAGSWGSMFPVSGHNSNDEGSTVELGALLASRAMYLSHRRGTSLRTYKKDTLCKPLFSVIYPKTQYRWQLLGPIPDAKKAMWTGAFSMGWAAGKTRPTMEDPMFMMFRWNDCCMGYGG